MKINKLPTGYLFSQQYSKGELETLSIGDYGKAHNIKADFLGHTRELHGVPNVPCMPLQEKWVITLSTQYGCPMKCTFCDVPKYGMKGNANFQDLKDQLYAALGMFPDVRYTERLNIHFARMGEPIFNQNVFEFSQWMYENKRLIQQETGVAIETLHPVLTTSLPRNFKQLEERILMWCDIKNELYNGQAGLQFSINSTCEDQRTEMYNDMQLRLSELAKIADKMPMPISRKYCLNFALASNYEVDAQKLRSMFDPEKFMVKITPIHNNDSCRENGIETIGGYDSYTPYKQAEEDLIAAGYDVIVFIPSMDEEDGLVTCGNLALSGREPVTSDVVRIIGVEDSTPKPMPLDYYV